MFENRPLVPSLVVLSVDQPIEPTMNHANAEALLSYGGPKIKKATMKWAFPLETKKSVFNASHTLFVEPIQKLVAALVVFVHLHL